MKTAVLSLAALAGLSTTSQAAIFAPMFARVVPDGGPSVVLLVLGIAGLLWFARKNGRR